jgi:hypothetical protein
MIETLLDIYYLVINNLHVLSLITIVSTLLFTYGGLLCALIPPFLYKIRYNTYITEKKTSMMPGD